MEAGMLDAGLLLVVVKKVSPSTGNVRGDPVAVAWLYRIRCFESIVAYADVVTKWL